MPSSLPPNNYVALILRNDYMRIVYSYVRVKFASNKQSIPEHCIENLHIMYKDVIDDHIKNNLSEKECAEVIYQKLLLRN